MYGRMQQDGRIDSFDVVIFAPNGGIDGYMEVRGTAEQLSAVRESDEFLKSLTEAGLVVHGLRVVDGYTGAGIARVMGMYQEAISAVPVEA
jgi:hypothetical protein